MRRKSALYRHITLASQRRTANRRSVEKDGLFLSTFSQGALGRSAKEGTAVRTTKMMHGHLPTAARMAMWGGDKDGSLDCACGTTLEWENGKVAHLQNHMYACGCPEERKARARWAMAVRSLTKSAVKHDRVDEVTNAIMACWGADHTGDIATAPRERRAAVRGETTQCRVSARRQTRLRAGNSKCGSRTAVRRVGARVPGARGKDASCALERRRI